MTETRDSDADAGTNMRELSTGPLKPKGEPGEDVLATSRKTAE